MTTVAASPFAILARGYAPWGAALAGATAGLAFLVIVWDAISGGITRMGYLYVIGGAFAAHGRPSRSYAIGLVVHGALSIGYGSAYAALFEALDASAVGEATAIGLLVGVVHGAIALLLAGWYLERVHPLVREGRLPAPGRALTGYGASTPFVWIAAHAVFGLTVGAVYAAASR